MSFRADILRKRLNRVEAIIRPSGSFAAKLAALHPEHRRIYDAWKIRNAEYWSQFEGEEPYRVLLGEITPLENPPVLPFYVKNKLHPPMDANADPFETYMQLLESMNGKIHRPC